MSAEDMIGMLQSGLAGDDPADWRRKAARIAWVKKTIAELRAAQRRADKAWERMLARFTDDIADEELEDLPLPAEQAEVDALHADIRAIIDHDRWPRKLHWSQ
jgi:hypothetical protein